MVAVGIYYGKSTRQKRGEGVPMVILWYAPSSFNYLPESVSQQIEILKQT